MCIVVASTKRLQAGRDILGLKKAENQELMLIFYILQGKRHELLARSFPDMSARFFFSLSASFTQRWSWLRKVIGVG